MIYRQYAPVSSSATEPGGIVTRPRSIVPARTLLDLDRYVGDGSVLRHRTLAVLAVVGVTALLTYALGAAVRATIGVRITSEQENLGLNGMFQDTGRQAEIAFEP